MFRTLFFLFVLSSAALAAQPYLVKDINGSPAGSAPREIVDVGSTTLIATWHNYYMGHVYAASGGGVTKLLHDCYALGLTRVGAEVFFFVGWPHWGAVEVWKTDGTTSGTMLVTTLSVGLNDFELEWAIECNGEFYFSWGEPGVGSEIWRSDGTFAGSGLVMDIYPGWESSEPSRPVVFNGAMYFAANDGMNGRELWRSDGTAAGTAMLADLNAGAGQSLPADLTVAGGKLYFAATSATYGRELWFSDGTAAGTQMFIDAVAGAGDSDPRHLTAWGNDLFFSTLNMQNLALSQAGNIRQLWRTDGTTAGTSAYYTTFGLAMADEEVPLAFAGRILFWGYFGSFGVSLIASDASQTAPVSGSPAPASMPSQKLELAGRALFTGTGTEGTELWAYDGTAAMLVKDVLPGAQGSSPKHLTLSGGLLWFTADDGMNGREPWTSDGTSAGTRMYEDLHTGTDSTAIWAAKTNGNRMFFRAFTPETGNELWVTDGTNAGTYMVADIAPGPAAGFVEGTAIMGSNAYFVARVQLGQQRLWRSDGTSVGTYELSGASADGKPPIAAGNLVFFVADGGDGKELWATDGTAGGTSQVRDIRPGATGSNPSLLGSAGGLLYFAADDGTHGLELWRSDGTAAGTFMLADIQSGAPASWPYMAAGVASLFYFTAEDSPGNRELWASDGTIAGTYKVAEINAGAGSYPNFLTPGATLLYFMADDGSGSDYWRTDGTAAGTYKIRNRTAMTPCVVAPGTDDLYFISTDATAAPWIWDLWRSSGTVATTTKLTQLGAPSSLPVPLGHWLGRTYVAMNDGVDGSELWSTDGTIAGTRQEADIHAGPDSSRIYWALFTGTSMYFSAYQAGTGQGLWAMPISHAPLLALGGGVTFDAPNGPVLVCPGATVGDPDTAAFDGGVLHIQVAVGATAADLLAVRAGAAVSVAGSDVQYIGTTIGTLSTAPGSLTVTLNASATHSATQALLQAIEFSTLPAATTNQRVLVVSLTDGAGGLASGTVSVFVLPSGVSGPSPSSPKKRTGGGCTAGTAGLPYLTALLLLRRRRKD